MPKTLKPRGQGEGTGAKNPKTLKPRGQGEGTGACGGGTLQGCFGVALRQRQLRRPCLPGHRGAAAPRLAGSCTPARRAWRSTRGRTTMTGPSLCRRQRRGGVPRHGVRKSPPFSPTQDPRNPRRMLSCALCPPVGTRPWMMTCRPSGSGAPPGRAAMSSKAPCGAIEVTLTVCCIID